MFLPDVDPVLADFEKRIETATTCAELFGIRDNLDPTDPRRARIDDLLMLVGCHNSDATPVARSHLSIERMAYRVAHINASYSRESLYQESNASDPFEAAKWYAGQVSAPGIARWSSFLGCLDALHGKPRRL